MTLQTEAATQTRLITTSKNPCPQCSTALLAPEWSEFVSERCVRHSWACETCGYQFETTVVFPAAAAA